MAPGKSCRPKWRLLVLRLAAGAAFLVAVLLAIPTMEASPPTAAQEEQGLARLAWLQGCWEARSGQRVITESWTAPRGGAMICLGTTVRRDTLVEYELIVLRHVGGAYAYEAHPSGQPVATFTAASATDTSVVFANPTHDYPQEVGYRRAGADSLIAWIDGISRGKSRRVEFRYARISCVP